MADLRPLRIRVPDELVDKAKAVIGDPDASDTIVIRWALAALAGEDPVRWAIHHRPGPPKTAA
jgi:hypothetical protein